ncbi:hypothetical protein OSTOST_01339 [Ostertagia ostertagi]
MRLAIFIVTVHSVLAEDNFPNSMAIEVLPTEKTPFAASEDIFTTDDLGSFSRAPESVNEAEAPLDLKPPTTEVKPPSFAPQPPGEQDSLHRLPQKYLDRKNFTNSVIAAADSIENQPNPSTSTYGDLFADSAVHLSKRQLNTDEMESSGEQKLGLSAAGIDPDDDDITDNSEGSGHRDKHKSIERVSGEVNAGLFCRHCDERNSSVVRVSFSTDSNTPETLSNPKDLKSNPVHTELEEKLLNGQQRQLRLPPLSLDNGIDRGKSENTSIGSWKRDPEDRLENHPEIQKQLQEFASDVKQLHTNEDASILSKILDVEMLSRNGTREIP